MGSAARKVQSRAAKMMVQKGSKGGKKYTVPERATCSRASVTKGEGRAPASLEKSLLCRIFVHSPKLYDQFRPVKAEAELCALRGCKTMYKNNSMELDGNNNV